MIPHARDPEFPHPSMLQMHVLIRDGERLLEVARQYFARLQISNPTACECSFDEPSHPSGADPEFQRKCSCRLRV